MCVWLDPEFVVIAAEAKMVTEPPGDDNSTCRAALSNIQYNDNDTIITITSERASSAHMRAHGLSTWRR